MRTAVPNKWVWSVVWFAPVPCSSPGRSALTMINGTAAWLASRTAGCRLATAVPEVVNTGTGRRVSLARPRARKAAERSSTRTCNRSRPQWSASCRAYAKAAEREPGQRTASRTPWRTSSSTTTVAKAVDGFTLAILPQHQTLGGSDSQRRIALCPHMLDCLSASSQGSLQSLTASGSRDQRGTQCSAERVTRPRGVEHLGLFDNGADQLVTIPRCARRPESHDQ